MQNFSELTWQELSECLNHNRIPDGLMTFEEIEEFRRFTCSGLTPIIAEFSETSPGIFRLEIQN